GGVAKGGADLFLAERLEEDVAEAVLAGLDDGVGGVVAEAGGEGKSAVRAGGAEAAVALVAAHVGGLDFEEDGVVAGIGGESESGGGGRRGVEAGAEAGEEGAGLAG